MTRPKTLRDLDAMDNMLDSDFSNDKSIRMQNASTNKSEEWRINHLEGIKNRNKNNQEWKKNVAESAKIRNSTDAHKQKLRDRYKDPEYKEKHKQAVINGQTAESNNKRSKSLVERNKDPDLRLKIRNATIKKIKSPYGEFCSRKELADHLMVIGKGRKTIESTCTMISAYIKSEPKKWYYTK